MNEVQRALDMAGEIGRILAELTNRLKERLAET
jgi:hypothetical protein